MWWYEPLLSLPKKVQEVVDEWTADETLFDEYLAEEYGRQIEQMVWAACEWLKAAPEDEQKLAVTEALAAIRAMKPLRENYFGRLVLD